ncbi:MAG: anti-sigma factor antagonist [Candidatus Auribacter fodinae]|jgi:anti-sigma B factor antagonist|uniref:Anti-sigma factor antagonist n=1 Tax=Candidatus Auribacter fodinae TaxID=2093366 RepID=A0A3A4R0X7_9BACT|nr:MAG: anti-sigma factor antagonist [Candidatus Auribacter fodinae]
MNIAQRTFDSWIILDLNGKLNEVTAKSLTEKVQECLKNGHINLILNFRGIEFINSPGLGTLISLTKLISRNKGKLRLINLCGFVLELFKATKLNTVFDIYSSEEEAIK